MCGQNFSNMLQLLNWHGHPHFVCTVAIALLISHKIKSSIDAYWFLSTLLKMQFHQLRV